MLPYTNLTKRYLTTTFPPYKIHKKFIENNKILNISSLYNTYIYYNIYIYIYIDIYIYIYIILIYVYT